MVAMDTISVQCLQEEMVRMEADFMQYKEAGNEKKPLTQKRCGVKVTFDAVDMSIFDRNVVLNTSPPTLLLLSSMSDFSGTVAAVKLWTSALCEMLQCTPSAFITRWGKMGEEGEKEKVVADLNEAFGKTWACSVSVTLWEKNDGSVLAQVNVNNCLVT
jgi:hypothetical protein